jgi:AbrB family looped-hinge helix DNA binding protein
VSKNGQIVLPASARRAAGIEAGDLVVSVPVAPGAVLVEKVEVSGGPSLKELYEATDELRGLWGDDPDAWLDELRGPWTEAPAS